PRPTAVARRRPLTTATDVDPLATPATTTGAAAVAARASSDRLRRLEPVGHVVDEQRRQRFPRDPLHGGDRLDEERRGLAVDLLAATTSGDRHRVRIVVTQRVDRERERQLTGGVHGDATFEVEVRHLLEHHLARADELAVTDLELDDGGVEPRLHDDLR